MMYLQPLHSSPFKHQHSLPNLPVLIFLTLINSAGPEKCHLKHCCPVLANCFLLWLYAIECQLDYLTLRKHSAVHVRTQRRLY